MWISQPRIRTTRPLICAEALESRQMLSAADPTIPVLLDTLVSTKNKWAKFSQHLADGSNFSVKEKFGTVNVYAVDNRLQLVATGTEVRSRIVVDGTIVLANVSVTGPLKLFQADGSNLAGVMAVNGSVDKLILESISGTVSTTANLNTVDLKIITGTLDAAGSINKLTVDSINGGTVLSGTSLGADGLIGGGDDSYGAGFIKTMTVTGPVINSTIAVGINPGPDGIFGTADDTRVANAGTIDKLTLEAGADPTSRCEAGGFGKVRSTPYQSLKHAKKLPNPLADSHFIVPPL